MNSHPASPAGIYHNQYPPNAIDNYGRGRPQSVVSGSSYTQEPSVYSQSNAQTGSSRARTPYSDEMGFVSQNGYVPGNPPLPTSYPTDRKQRPQSMPQQAIQQQMVMAPGPSGPRPNSANTGNNPAFNPMQLIPPATQSVGKAAHQLQTQNVRPQTAAPPPYEESPSPTEASTVITPLSMNSNQRLILTNPSVMSPPTSPRLS
jgi:hypothetical protein